MRISKRTDDDDNDNDDKDDEDDKDDKDDEDDKDDDDEDDDSSNGAGGMDTSQFGGGGVNSKFINSNDNGMEIDEDAFESGGARVLGIAQLVSLCLEKNAANTLKKYKDTGKWQRPTDREVENTCVCVEDALGKNIPHPEYALDCCIGYVDNMMDLQDEMNEETGDNTQSTSSKPDTGDNTKTTTAASKKKEKEWDETQVLYGLEFETCLLEFCEQINPSIGLIGLLIWCRFILNQLQMP